MATGDLPSARAIWFERLRRRMRPDGERRVRELGHELLKIQSHAGRYADLGDGDREAALERVLAEFGDHAGIGPPPPPAEHAERPR
jgi:hypothetical protein